VDSIRASSTSAKDEAVHAAVFTGGYERIAGRLTPGRELANRLGLVGDDVEQLADFRLAIARAVFHDWHRARHSAAVYALAILEFIHLSGLGLGGSEACGLPWPHGSCRVGAWRDRRHAPQGFGGGQQDSARVGATEVSTCAVTTGMSSAMAHT